MVFGVVVYLDIFIYHSIIVRVSFGVSMCCIDGEGKGTNTNSLP